MAFGPWRKKGETPSPEPGEILTAGIRKKPCLVQPRAYRSVSARLTIPRCGVRVRVPGMSLLGVSFSSPLVTWKVGCLTILLDLPMA